MQSRNTCDCQVPVRCPCCKHFFRPFAAGKLPFAKVLSVVDPLSGQWVSMPAHWPETAEDNYAFALVDVAALCVPCI